MPAGDDRAREGSATDGLVLHDPTSARDAFGPGWHALLKEAFDFAQWAPWYFLADGLRLGRRDGGLEIRIDSVAYTTFDEWLVAQMRLTGFLERSRGICEACGAAAFQPAPRRSTRSHCNVHAMDWAAGLPEAVIWSASDGWREGTTGWSPTGEYEDDRD